MFVSAYSKERRSNEPTPSGNEIEPVFSYVVDKKGMKVLQQTGKKNIQDEINSYLEETKIENIIARVVAGDESVLRPDAIYADISQMPKNMIEAMAQVKAMENTYAELSEELKEKYPTIENFVEAAGTEAWMIDNGYITRPVEEKLEKTETTIAKAIEQGAPNES